MSKFTNRQVAERFTQIADLLDIKGENRFKILAYRRASENILSLGRDINAIYEADELRDVPGIGKAIQDKIAELLSSGQMNFWEKLIVEVPPSLISILAVPGIGPKTVRLLWQKLNVTTLEGLKETAESGQLSTLPGLGVKTQANILAGIAALARRQTDRVRLDIAWSTAMDIINTLQTFPEVLRLEQAGSLRRFAPTIGDLDILVATYNPDPVMAAFKSLPGVEEVLGSGHTKTSVRFENSLQADLRCLEPEHWGTAMQYFTGSKAHNVKIRELAQRQGLSLNEYALTRPDGSQILCADEADVYAALGLPFIPPPLREDRGEVEAAVAGDLPSLVQNTDIKGEVHCHSTWSDGKGTIEEMARAALAHGYEYLVITDHSQSLGIANGLTPERLRQQRRELEAAQARVPGIRLLQGTEMEIKADGTLDFDDEVLATLDFVVASVHTGLQQDRDTLTARTLQAIGNPHVRAIGHPTGRLLGKREGGDFDIEALLRSAAETGTMMEVNAATERLDLDSIYIKRAIEVGVTLVINCDAHSPAGFESLQFGVATAQRGWATPVNIGNTYSLEELLSLKNNGGSSMPTILYAEDDRDCRELFSFVLRQKDFTVYEANNGAQAVQIVREEPVDLVILDVRMPMMSGYDAARLIAREAPDTPILFLSAKGLSREVDKGFDSGRMVVDYLVKPISPTQLVDRVLEVLSEREKRGLAAVRERSLAQFVELRQHVN